MALQVKNVARLTDGQRRAVSERAAAIRGGEIGADGDLKPPPLTVLYGGAWPLCRRELGVCRVLRPNAPACFADVSDPASQLPSGSTHEQ